MKTLKIFIALLFISVSTARAQFTRAELQVSGLTCSMCSKATEKSLRTLHFISDVKVDLNRNVFMITFKKDLPVNLEQISGKVENAGFFVNCLKATFNFDNVKVAGNTFVYSGNTYRLVNGNDKPLSGDVPVTVVDKGFAPASVYKKYNASEKAENGRMYHIVI
jgi:copper chaperone CopZ